MSINAKLIKVWPWAAASTMDIIRECLDCEVV